MTGSTARKVLIGCVVATAGLALVAAIAWMSTSAGGRTDAGIPSSQGVGEASPDGRGPFVAEEANGPMGVTMPSGSVYGNTPSNVLGGGGFCAYEGWIYYDSLSDNLSLHRMLADGSGDVRVLEQGANGLALYDGWVYYIDAYDHITRVRPNGEGEEQISDISAHWLNVVDGWLYVVKMSATNGSAWGGEVWKMRADGSDQTLLREGVWEYLAAYEGWLYFSSPGEDLQHQKLCRMDYLGEGFQELGVDANPYVPTSDWVFYHDLSDNSLGRMRHDGSEAQKVSDASPASMAVLGDWVYFVDRGDGEAWLLYRMDIGTSEQRLVTDKACLGVHAVGDRILYTEHEGPYDLFAYAEGNEMYLADPDGSNALLIDKN